MSDCTVRPKLRECPFCGGENIQVIEYKAGYGTIGCGDCYFEYPDNGNLKPLDELREAWNTRAERTCTNEWEQFGKFKCSNCSFEISYLSTYPPSPVPISYCFNRGAKVVDA